jgi:hypothetical protein
MKKTNSIQSNSLLSLSNINSELSNQSTSFIYVTNNIEREYLIKSIVLTGDTSYSDSIIDDTLYAQFALLFPNVSTILVPKKVEYNLRKYVSKPLLKEIDEDINVAVEKCLIFLSNLASTKYTEDKWKELSSVVLHEQTKNDNDNTYIYTKIVKALKAGTSKGPIIEVKKNDEGLETYETGEACKAYRLTESYLNAGLIEYNLQDSKLIQKRNKSYYKQIKEANNNTIAANLLNLYSEVDLPTLEEIKAEGKRLVKEGYITKKGKKLTIRNKHVNEYWKDYKDRSFVEDSIELYEFLTNRGFMIPIIGDERSGGRVVDSFTLMPSWIRNLIKFNGENVIECDYRALHPNIAMTLYKGSKKFVTHQLIASEANLPVSEVKIEHLSFFNKTVRDMKGSKLYNYYLNEEPKMIKAIEEDKINSAKKHKITATKMFSLEVAMMTEVIRRMNKKGINVGYVYDALLTTAEHIEELKKVMDEVALEYDVNTTASFKPLLGVSYDIKIEDKPEAINIAVENDTTKLDEKKRNMETRFKDELKFASPTAYLTPAEFNRLTNNKLESLYTKYFKEISNVSKNDFEKFWILIQKMKTELVK